MYEIPYFELILEEDQYILNTRTKEKITKNFVLNVWDRDSDGKFYDSPVYDDYQDFVLITPMRTVSVEQLLLEKSNNMYFAYISNHEKLCKILPMELLPTDKYYAIPVNFKTKDFLIQAGLDHFSVEEKSAGTYLIRFSNIVCDGYELLFFINGDSDILNDYLNELRIEVLEENLKNKIKLLQQKGISVKVKNKIYKFPDTPASRYDLEKSLDKENFIKISALFKHNQELLEKYRETYFKEIETSMKNLRDISLFNPKLLYFGYVSKEMYYEIFVED